MVEVKQHNHQSRDREGAVPLEATQPANKLDESHAVESPRPRRVELLAFIAPLCSAAIGVIAFAPSLDNQFVFDDHGVILDNPMVTQPAPWYRFWTEPYWPRHRSSDKLYRPLTSLSFRLNTILGPGAEPDPRAFHIVNLVLHALACAGVAVFARRATGRSWAGLIAGGLFAAHPVHTEAVVTGYGRGELLAGVFVVWLLARHVRPEDPARPRRPWFPAVSGLLLLAGIMSKESVVLAWPVILVLDLWHRRQTPMASRLRWRDWLNRTLAPPHAAFMLACSTFFFLRFALFGMHYRLAPERTRAWLSPLAHADWVEQLLTPLRLLWLTLGLMVRPARLCPIWSVPALPLARGMEADVVAGAALLIMLLTLVAVLWFRRSLYGAIVLGLLILLALPTHAIPAAHWLFAERWLYAPSLLIAVLAAGALARLGWMGTSAGLAAAVILLPATWSYSAAFESGLAMSSEILRRQPNNFVGQRNLAVQLYRAERYPAAIHAAQELIDRFEPMRDRFGHVSEGHLIQAMSYVELGDGRRALAVLEAFARDAPPVIIPGYQGLLEQANALVASDTDDAEDVE